MTACLGPRQPCEHANPPDASIDDTLHRPRSDVHRLVRDGGLADALGTAGLTKLEVSAARYVAGCLLGLRIYTDLLT
jgi:hypothetical protein